VKAIDGPFDKEASDRHGVVDRLPTSALNDRG